MPKYADRFSGHMPEGDPRGPMWMSWGCDWPTCPAYKYLVVSDDATGFLSFLNTTGVLLEWRSQFIGTTKAEWVGPKNVVPVTIAWMNLEWFKHLDSGEWNGWIFPSACSQGVHMVVPIGYRPCNKTVPIGDFTIPPPCESSTGSTCRMLQVEFDKETPPGGWP
jgi:hypothetical protein